MTRRRGLPLPIIAWLFALVGLGTSVMALREAPRLDNSIRRKRMDVAEARRLRAELTRLDGIRAAWDTLSGAPLTAPEEIFRRMATDLAAPEWKEREPEPIADGWRRRRVEGVFHEAPLEWIGAFVNRCAEARPPWRLARIHVVVSESSRGYGSVTMTLEGLEREETAP